LYIDHQINCPYCNSTYCSLLEIYSFLAGYQGDEKANEQRECSKVVEEATEEDEIQVDQE
jgi:hypothetical protein